MSLLKCLTAALLLLSPAAAVCQEGSREVCPRVEVMCPTEAVEHGAPMTFSAKVSGGDPDARLTFNWIVSAGTITSGQGTPSITVDTTGLAGQNIRAAVEVGGLSESCAKVESCAAGVTDPPACGMPFDLYSLELTFEDEKARLDNFAIALQQEVSARGFILVHAGDRARPDAVKTRARLAWSYLTGERGIHESRLVLVYEGDDVYGGGPSGETTLRIVPYGSDFTITGEIINPHEVQPDGSKVSKGRRGKR